MQSNAENVKKIDEMLPGVSLNTQEAIRETLQIALNPTKEIVITRALQILSHTVKFMDIKALENIASEPTASDVWLSLSEESIALEAQKSVTEDSLRSLRLKGIRAKHELLEKEGGVITSSQVAEILGITRQAVDKRRKQGKILAVSLGKRSYIYPVWQFSDNGVLTGFDKVMEKLDDFDAWMKFIFMLNPNDRLNNKTPLEVLHQGELARVLQAAESILEQGAL